MPNSRGPRFQSNIHTCTVMFLFIVCDMFSSIASLMSNTGCSVLTACSPTPFALRFSPPSARRGCSIRSRCLGSRKGRLCMCAGSSQANVQAPPTKITTRVKAQQPGRKRTPSLQEGDSDPAVTDQQSQIGRWKEIRNRRRVTH